MSTKIGLVSDVHATPEPLAEALAIFDREGVDQILCAGDIAGYGEALDETIGLLQGHAVLTIIGNHDRWYLENHAQQASANSCRFLKALPTFMGLNCEGRSLYMVHASPPDLDRGGIKLLNEHAQIIPEQRVLWSQHLADFGHDILIVGHTHQVFAEQLASTLVINPGSTVFNHSCAILNLPEMRLDWFALSGKEPVKTWNWSSGLDISRYTQ